MIAVCGSVFYLCRQNKWNRANTRGALQRMKWSNLNVIFQETTISAQKYIKDMIHSLINIRNNIKVEPVTWWMFSLSQSSTISDYDAILCSIAAWFYFPQMNIFTAISSWARACSILRVNLRMIQEKCWVSIVIVLKV